MIIKDIKLKGNILYINKKFLYGIIGAIVIVIAIFFIVKDSPYDKTMDELDKADQEINKAIDYLRKNELVKSDIAFDKSLEYIENSVEYIENNKYDLSEKKLNEIELKLRSIVVKGIVYSFGKGFSIYN